VPQDMQIHADEITSRSSAQVAEGGFADLYKGVLWRKHPIAMKHVRVKDDPRYGTRERMEKLVQREVKVWCRLRHRYVLPFIGTYEFESTINMVSPWMANGSAKAYIKNNPNVDCVKLLLQAAQGLEYLHTFHPVVVHGDIKGNNILISESGDACIADFGLSSFVQEGGESYSASWKYGGNVRWQAPELWGKAPNNKRTRETDTFAFGRMIYELLTGELPFALLEPLQIVIQGNLLPPRPDSNAEAVRRGLDDRMWKLLSKCHMRAPRKRPLMTTVVSKLEAIHQSISLQAHADTRARGVHPYSSDLLRRTFPLNKLFKRLFPHSRRLAHDIGE